LLSFPLLLLSHQRLLAVAFKVTIHCPLGVGRLLGPLGEGRGGGGHWEMDVALYAVVSLGLQRERSTHTFFTFAKEHTSTEDSLRSARKSSQTWQNAISLRP
jgi:hypothetical protein